MTADEARTGGTLGSAQQSDLRRALGRSGLRIDLGAATVQVQSDSPEFALQLQSVYRHFPFESEAGWADLNVRIRRPYGLRRWYRPQIVFQCDSRRPFEPFPADSPLPLFEWGCNALIGRRLNDLLLLHAGVVERGGLALILPALPGSGKSTLTAALSHRGWRLLSDEFGAYDPESGAFRAMLKPIALKNQSIEVIRRFAPQAAFGPEFPKTRRGTVAHMAAPQDAVAGRHKSALPGAIVLPKWVAGSPTRLEPLEQSVVFPALAFNAFNYGLLGALGFQSAVSLVRQCLAWQLIYSDLDEALAAIDDVWPQVLERRATATS